MGGGGGGNSGGGTSVTTQEIPAELKPLASRYTQEATKLFDTPYQAYTGQRYADLNNIQNTALQSTINRSMDNSTINNATSNLNQVMSGGQNPYLDAMVNRAQQNVMSNYGTAAMNSGSFGNSGLGQQLAQGLTDTATQMYGNAYAQDQSNRLSAISMAPTINQAGYQNAQQLMNAGQTLQDQQQQNMDFNYQNFLDKQNYPYKNLAAAAGVFGSNLGGSSTTTSNQSSSGGGK